MDRRNDARACEKRSRQRQKKRENHEKHIPGFEHPPFFLNDDRMEKCGGGKPGHERGVFYRIPRPVASPPEDFIRPRSSQEISAGEKEPGGDRPFPNLEEPLIIETTGDERGHGERKRYAHPDIAEVKRRRMNHHV